MIEKKMFNGNYKQQFTGLVHEDRKILRINALQAKKLNEKCDTIATIFETIAAKQKELRAEEQLNEEYRAKIVELSETEVRLRQQIAKMKKNQIDLSNIRGTFLPEDEQIYTKDVLKLNLLSVFTPLQFATIKTKGRVSLVGYTSKNGQIHEFTTELPPTIHAKRNLTELLWAHVKGTSPHINQWRQLFPQPPINVLNGTETETKTESETMQC